MKTIYRKYFQTKSKPQILLGLLFFTFCSCSTIDKALHHDKYCIETNCHKKRKTGSVYCEDHYRLKMEELVNRAEAAKNEAIEEEKNHTKNNNNGN